METLRTSSYMIPVRLEKEAGKYMLNRKFKEKSIEAESQIVVWWKNICQQDISCTEAQINISALEEKKRYIIRIL